MMNDLLPMIINALLLLVLIAGILLSLLVDALFPQRSVRFIQGIVFTTLFSVAWLLLLQFNGLQRPDIQGFLTNDFWSLSLLFLVVFCTLISFLSAEPIVQRGTRNISAKIIILLFACSGLGLAVSTHHLLACFLGLELFGLSTRSLLYEHGGSWKSGEALLKSFITNSMSSGIFLLGIGFIFSAFGTLDLNQINNLVISPTQTFLPSLGVAFILVGLFSKLAVVPFQAWLTDFSEGAPAPWAGFIVAASPLTVIGFLLRFVINTNVSQIPHLKLCLVIFAALSIIWGSFVALKQEELKRFTTCLVVAQTGFILLILALGITPQGLSANTIETIFIVLAANTILSLGAFSTLATLTNNENNSIQLANLQGLAKTNPLTSLTLSLFFLGLAGIPITVGFVARYRALWTVIQTGSYTAIAGLLIVSVVYAFSCLRPVRVLFAKEQTTQTLQPTLTVPAMIAITLCVFLTISLGVNPSLLIKIAGLIEMSLQ